MLKSILCGYIDAYILVTGTLIVGEVGTTERLRRTDRNNKQVIL